jgi:hypothetical protein
MISDRRLKEVLNVMSEVRHLGFPLEYEGYKELSARMNDYIRTGDGWSGKIKFSLYKRVLHVKIPKDEKIPIEIVLKHMD